MYLSKGFYPLYAIGVHLPHSANVHDIWRALENTKNDEQIKEIVMRLSCHIIEWRFTKKRKKYWDILKTNRGLLIWAEFTFIHKEI